MDDDYDEVRCAAWAAVSTSLEHMTRFDAPTARLDNILRMPMMTALRVDLR